MPYSLKNELGPFTSRMLTMFILIVAYYIGWPAFQRWQAEQHKRKLDRQIQRYITVPERLWDANMYIACSEAFKEAALSKEK